MDRFQIKRPVNDEEKEIIKKDRQYKEINVERINKVINEFEKLSIDPLTEATDEILKYRTVMLLSLVDLYFSLIIKHVVVVMYKNHVELPSKWKDFKIPISIVRKAIENVESFDWLNESFDLEYGKKTFQAPTKIKDILRLVDNKIIDKYNKKTQFYSWDAVVLELEDLFKRRNMIVHQYDFDNDINNINSINKDYVLKKSKFLNKFIVDINSLIEEVLNEMI